MLTHAFGLHRIDMVEDVVQETLLRALRTWPNHGIPENPQAWLYRAARNLAIDQMRRDANLSRKETELIVTMESDLSLEDFEPVYASEIRDAQLRMLFACCHPSLPFETQVAIALKELCGFSIAEIARAFMAEQTTIAQRIVRGKKLFRSGAIPLAVPEPSELGSRLDAALAVIYLIFNEGYARHSGADLLSSDVADEAIRLAKQLTENSRTNNPDIHALLALCCFQRSRFAARVNADGELVRLEDQDRTLWDKRFIAEGFSHLELAAKGEQVSRYHLEAGIASIHAMSESFERTNWKAIVEIYEQLVEINDSPVVLLNRAVALGYWKGPEVGLAALEQSPRLAELQAYHLYHATVADLLVRLHRPDEAAPYFRQALRMTDNEAERGYLSRRLNSLAIGS